MPRKCKAEREEEERRFRQQSGTFKNPYVQYTHFHAHTDKGTTVTSSVLSRTKSKDCASPLPGDMGEGQGTSNGGDNQEHKRTLVRLIYHRTSDVFMVDFLEFKATGRLCAAFRPNAGAHARIRVGPSHWPAAGIPEPHNVKTASNKC
jgi:hypothetical protein